MTEQHPVISSTGRYLPGKTLSSEELEEDLELEEGWIETRTGIRSRQIADGDTTMSMAIEAGKKALRSFSVNPRDIHLTVLATSTPDQPLPPTAPAVQEELNTAGGGFDLAGSCVGFLDGLSVAEQYIRTGKARHTLVIGANHLSYRVNWTDPQTACLFADGAGAAVLSAPESVEDPAGLRPEVIATKTASDGSLHGNIEVPAGGSREPFSPGAWKKNRHLMRMKNGDKIFKKAIQKQVQVANELLSETSRSIDDVDWLLPHQANLRIMEAVCKSLGLPESKLLSNVETTGNTSAASIPILLDECVRNEEFSKNDLILSTAFGSGLRYGAALLSC